MAADGGMGKIMRRVLMTWAEQQDRLPAPPGRSVAVLARHVAATRNPEPPSVTTTVIVLTPQERRRLLHGG
jgi:hypothetical protein